MRAARYHRVGEPFTVDVVARPQIGPTDVLVRVEACGVVPNLRNVLENLPPDMAPLPLPAVYGLDAAGVVTEVGSAAIGTKVGDRVYVNPMRSCGSCRRCRAGRPQGCSYIALNGYMGSGPDAAQMLKIHPSGGFAEYVAAPAASLVVLPDRISFETAARWGYLGTSYAALRRASVSAGTTVLINGVSGTLGIGALVFALGLGASAVLGVGRNTKLLAKVRGLDPKRIHVHSTSVDGPVTNRARELTSGEGFDVVIDALPKRGASAAFVAARNALGRAGVHVNIGGVTSTVPVDVFSMVNNNQSMLGSFWFTTRQGQEMADLVEAGSVELPPFEHRTFSLKQLDEAVVAAAKDSNGFTNFVVTPQQ